MKENEHLYEVQLKETGSRWLYTLLIPESQLLLEGCPRLRKGAVVKVTSDEQEKNGEAGFIFLLDTTDRNYEIQVELEEFFEERRMNVQAYYKENDTYKHLCDTNLTDVEQEDMRQYLSVIQNILAEAVTKLPKFRLYVITGEFSFPTLDEIWNP